MTDDAGHLTDELSALLDGELPADEAAAAQAHLAQCALCTAELAAFNRTRDMVRSLPVVDPPGVITLADREGVSDRADRAVVAGRVRRGGRGRRGVGADPGSRPPRTAPLVAAAAAAVLVVLQWVPAGRTVAPSLAGFGRTHSSVVQESSAQSTTAPDKIRLVRAPSTLGPGFQRVAAYRRDGVVHAVYSDGSRALSLFAQPGQLEEDALPAGGDIVERNGHTMHHWHNADGDVVLWQSRGVVYTAVGNAPVEQVMDAAASMPGEDPAYSVGQRLRRGCRALAEALTGG